MTEATPGAAIDRIAVWRYLQASHVEVAQRLRSEECKSSGWMALDGLPSPSRAFVWNILRRWKPGLAELLSDEDEMRAVKHAFDGTVAIDKDDLIEAVWGYLQQKAAEDGRAPSGRPR